MADSVDKREEKNKIRKRYKLSFVCQLCRRSKTKCDKKKPSCSRCERLQKPCVYDLEQQQLPRKPSKDAAITRLQKELEYWKYFAQSRMRGSNSVTTLDSDAEFGSTSRAEMEGMEKLVINLAKFKPQLVYKECRFTHMQSLSNISQIRNDCFISAFLAAFFASGSKESLSQNICPYLSYHQNNDDPKYIDRVLHLRQNLLMRFNTESQSNRIEDFTDRLITGRDVVINYRTAFFITIFSNVFFKSSIEDSRDSEQDYSPSLQQLILKANSLLPDKNALEVYKSYFYKRLYHIFPYFDIVLFEKVLDEILIPDDKQSNRMRFHLGTKDFKFKLSHIALLLLILKISFTALCAVVEAGIPPKYCDANFIRRNVVLDQCIIFAEICMAKMCMFEGTNEIHISCMLYIWYFFCVGNGDSDSIFGRSTDSITEILFTLASNNGLTKDPTQFQQHQLNPTVQSRLQNLRRQLSLSLVYTTVYSGIVTGNFEEHIWDGAKNFLRLNGGKDEYLGLVKQGIHTPNSLELKIQNVLFKNYKMMVQLMDIERLLKKGSAGMRVGEISDVSKYWTESLRINFPLDENCSGQPQTYHVTLTNGNVVSCDVIDSYHNVQMQLLVRNLLVHLNSSLFLYFEDRCINGWTNSLICYEKYLLDASKQALELAKLCISILNGKMDQLLIEDYNVARAMLDTEIVFPTVLYFLLGLGIRICHSELSLKDKIDNLGPNILNSKSLEVRYATLKKLRKNIFYVIKLLSDALGSSFHYKNFSTFKSILFVDALMNLELNDSLIDIIMDTFGADTQRLHKLDPLMKELINSAIAIDCDNPRNVTNSLENAQFISLLDDKFLLEVLNIIEALGMSWNHHDSSSLV